MAAGGLLRCITCVRPTHQERRLRRSEARLVLWGGETRAAEPGRAAGEVMTEHAGRVVCRADAFRVGRPAPVLGADDRLEAGRTYLVVPADRLPCGAAAAGGVLTAASLAALSSSLRSGGGNNKKKPGPFEYAKDADGRTVVRVTEEFIVSAVAGAAGGGGGRGSDGDGNGNGCGGPALCSTPELRKHYEQLVRGRPWSPRLDTIKERKGRRRLADVVGSVSPGRLSPVRLLGMDKQGLS